MMASISSLQLFQVLRPCRHHGESARFEANKNFQKHRAREGGSCTLSHVLSSHSLRQDWNFKLSNQINMPLHAVPTVHCVVTCQSALVSGHSNTAIIGSMKIVALALTRACRALQESSLVVQCAPAVGIMAFATWGLGPLLQFIRHLIFRRNDSNWKRSSTYHIMTSYLQPILLWMGAILICRAFDPVVLSSETRQAIKQRLLNFVRSLSTVLAFAYCTSSLIQQAQKFVMEHHDSQDKRNVGFQFVGKAIYTAVWVAAFSLFMELLGFSTQKWVTAGGLGTVLLTLAGREIFTNFLSSVMIHATRPFIVNEWIQTKIEGYEVSGTVEHVGWWSPTIVRGDDREAVHIPNHKFTVSIVRNLSQKSHWRIKTHLAISHLDANKIGIIVADMRKVLAKNPQVEQQRLHRRVFLDSIDRENQALLIFVSCFVKTPHIEEYLCVKEAILLDLLRVIGHHRARLATPIRSVQKIYYDSEMQNVPFGDTRFGRGMANSRPFLLAEASPKLNGEDKVKQRSPRSNEELNTVHPKPVASEAKGTEAALISSNDTVKQDSLDKKNIQNQKERDHTTVNLQSKNGKLSTMDGVQASPTKSHLEGLDSMGLNSKDITLLGAAFEKPPVNIPEVPVETGIPKSEKNISKNEKSTINSSDKQFHQNVSTSEKNMKKLSSEADSSITEVSREEAKSGSRFESDLRSDAGKQKGEEHSTLSSPKHESERSVNFPSISRPQLEENLVLGVALDGPKRTLPIGGEITSQVEQKEFSTCRNGNNNSIVKDRREAQLPSSHGVQPDQREQER
eukprot:Gb_15756 [translate_table: standard]